MREVANAPHRVANGILILIDARYDLGSSADMEHWRVTG
jgi:hypothetical protein